MDRDGSINEMGVNCELGEEIVGRLCFKEERPYKVKKNWRRLNKREMVYQHKVVIVNGKHKVQ